MPQQRGEDGGAGTQGDGHFQRRPYLLHHGHCPGRHGNHGGNGGGVVGLTAELDDLLQDVHRCGVEPVPLGGEAHRRTQACEGHPWQSWTLPSGCLTGPPVMAHSDREVTRVVLHSFLSILSRNLSKPQATTKRQHCATIPISQTCHLVTKTEKEPWETRLSCWALSCHLSRDRGPGARLLLHSRGRSRVFEWGSR